MSKLPRYVPGCFETYLLHKQASRRQPSFVRPLCKGHMAPCRSAPNDGFFFSMKSLTIRNEWPPTLNFPWVLFFIIFMKEGHIFLKTKHMKNINIRIDLIHSPKKESSICVQNKNLTLIGSFIVSSTVSPTHHRIISNQNLKHLPIIVAKNVLNNTCLGSFTY